MAFEEALRGPQRRLASYRSFTTLGAFIGPIFGTSWLCLHVAGAARLLAGDAAQLLEEVAMQMIDVHLPTTDGRELVLTRYTEPGPCARQPVTGETMGCPPKITAAPRATRCSADLRACSGKLRCQLPRSVQSAKLG